MVLWSLATLTGLVSPLFLPSPVAVGERFVTQLQNGELPTDASASVYRIAAGFLLATVMAVPIGILIGTSARVEAALEPLIDFVRYMPVVAFVPLTILWAGIDDGQKFLIIWMGTFFQQVLLIADAVRQTPRGLIDLGETLGLNNRQILTRIVLRSSAPRIWDALRITLGWAWTWLVVAELVAASSGLGYRITLGQRYFQTDTIITYVLILGVLGLVTDQIMRAWGRRMFRYERSSR
ncbi:MULTISPECIES: ABC transporter permease [Cryobacterium]|uniref:ABC transporter permease n=1 Tax=Cryobacterium TaxID=69578 RepID=UPI0008AF6FEA|nr:MULTISPECIES: ABC transporter permease [Cryobacterium]SEM76234.1 NitT/TauT family transport system permease protein [Cryobacterium luteum]